MDRIDPGDITGINARAHDWAAGRERVFPIAIERIIIEDDAIAALTEVTRHYAGTGRVLMVTDHTPMRRGGEELKPLIEAALGRGGPVTVRRLPDDPTEELHAELPIAQQLAGELAGYAAVVSVGSGTITDLVKQARHLATGGEIGKLPFVCFPTAASVTAFTSALAILICDGAKRNFTAGLPEAIVCDLRTLADAPLSMTRAGFGDVLARSVAYGDWYIAHQLGMDDAFSQVAGRLLEPAELHLIASAELVSAADPAGLRAVIEALLLAGMAMSLVNQTSPISGWEHVISHYLDMTADVDKRKPAWHGGQVGVGTLIAARAYERTWANLALEPLTAEFTDADLAAARRGIEAVFAPYNRTGGLIDELWREYERKLKRWQAGRDQRIRFAEQKRAGEFDGFLAKAVRSSEQVADALRRAGAPMRFADLNEPIPAAAGRAAIQSAHYVRARFTLGDLLHHSGWLQTDTVASLLDES